MIDIKEIRELCDKATPGPWESGHYGSVCLKSGFKLCNVEGQANAEFIAKSREIIPALLDAVEAAQNTQRWIPITERLPKKDTAVLCYTALGQKVGWIGNSGNFNFTYGKGVVTHWMPLPEPPKGESHE